MEKRSAFESFVNRAIDILYKLFIILTIMGAAYLFHETLNALPNRLFFILVASMVILLLFYSISPVKFGGMVNFIVKSAKQLMSKFPPHLLNKLPVISLFVLVILQMVLLTHISGYTDWDVGGIFKGARAIILNNNNADISRYLSWNPNNSFFFFIMYGWSKFGNLLYDGFGSTWFFWQLLNIIMIDVGIVCLYFIGKAMRSRRFGLLVASLGALLIGLSTWILVPYTDTFAFAYTAALLLVLMHVDKFKHWLIKGCVLGLLLCVGYLLKPSTLIPFIAFVTIRVVSQQLNWQAFIITVMTLIFSMAMYQSAVNHQSIVDIDHSISKPWTLFVMMGLKGDGGYDYDDTMLIRHAGDTKDGHELAKKVILTRLKKYGVTGYTKFLFQKHQYNTAQGTFGLGLDGSGIHALPIIENGLSESLRQLYYPKGSLYKMSAFIVQMFWLFILIMALCVPTKGRQFSLLKLTMIGLFIFLLLFEAGRSRYLIQLLPALILLSGLGCQNVIALLKKNGRIKGMDVLNADS